MPQHDPNCETCHGAGLVVAIDRQGRTREFRCSCYPLIGEIIVLDSGPVVCMPDNGGWLFRRLLKESWTR